MEHVYPVFVIQNPHIKEKNGFCDISSTFTLANLFIRVGVPISNISIFCPNKFINDRISDNIIYQHHQDYYSFNCQEFFVCFKEDYKTFIGSLKNGDKEGIIYLFLYEYDIGYLHPFFRETYYNQISCIIENFECKSLIVINNYHHRGDFIECVSNLQLSEEILLKYTDNLIYQKSLFHLSQYVKDSMESLNNLIEILLQIERYDEDFKDAFRSFSRDIATNPDKSLDDIISSNSPYSYYQQVLSFINDNHITTKNIFLLYNQLNDESIPISIFHDEKFNQILTTFFSFNNSVLNNDANILRNISNKVKSYYYFVPFKYNPIPKNVTFINSHNCYFDKTKIFFDKLDLSYNVSCGSSFISLLIDLLFFHESIESNISQHSYSQTLLQFRQFPLNDSNSNSNSESNQFELPLIGRSFEDIFSRLKITKEFIISQQSEHIIRHQFRPEYFEISNFPYSISSSDDEEECEYNGNNNNHANEEEDPIIEEPNDRMTLLAVSYPDIFLAFYKSFRKHLHNYHLPEFNLNIPTRSHFSSSISSIYSSIKFECTNFYNISDIAQFYLYAHNFFTYFENHVEFILPICCCFIKSAIDLRQDQNPDFKGKFKEYDQWLPSEIFLIRIKEVQTEYDIEPINIPRIRRNKYYQLFY